MTHVGGGAFLFLGCGNGRLAFWAASSSVSFFPDRGPALTSMLNGEFAAGAGAVVATAFLLFLVLAVESLAEFGFFVVVDLETVDLIFEDAGLDSFTAFRVLIAGARVGR